MCIYIYNKNPTAKVQQEYTTHIYKNIYTKNKYISIFFDATHNISSYSISLFSSYFLREFQFFIIFPCKCLYLTYRYIIILIIPDVNFYLHTKSQLKLTEKHTKMYTLYRATNIKVGRPP